MRIATWNVNSVRQRLEHLLSWLKECSPEIVCLQEIKCVDDAFPRLEIEALGYNVVTHGQKTFNGVALLSKLPFEETKSGLAGDDEDAHARFLEGVVTLKRGVLRVACLYLPNGNPPNTDKYPYKLKWMSRLQDYARERLKAEEPLVLAGDFNVIPKSEDVYNPAAWVDDQDRIGGVADQGLEPGLEGQGRGLGDVVSAGLRVTTSPSAVSIAARTSASSLTPDAFALSMI